MGEKYVNIRDPIQLLVEGNDGRNFFEAFRDHLALSGMQIHNYDGVPDLPKFLRGFPGTSNFSQVRRIGIVRDAEKSADSAFQSVQSALRNAHLTAPSKASLFAEGNPQTGVLILPRDGSGMLETVLSQSFAGTPVDSCIDEFFRCVKSEVGDEALRPEKARAHAYLATMPEPHVSVGVAAKKKYWNLDHEAFRPIRDFLQALCAA